MQTLYVIKRDGSRQDVRLDKITARVKSLCYNLNQNYVDPAAVTLRVVKGIRAGVTTEELDLYTANVAATMTYVHHDYAVLAGRILIDNMHKQVGSNFCNVVTALHSHGLVADELLDVAVRNRALIDAAIDHGRDFDYKYFGYKTLENGYLLKIGNKVAERPQHMLMRVAIGIHGDDMDRVLESYEMMSQKYFTHASPTMFAAGTRFPQMCSCFLLTMKRDSIEGIYSTLGDCAAISKYGGGIGVNVHKVRARGSRISSTNGTASGIEPMVRVFNNMVRHVDQGGKRKGALAVYIEPWHADIFSVLNLRRNMGAEDCKARDLMYALWVPDLFMKRVYADGVWSLMCPHKCPGLDDCYGEAFERLYTLYEQEGRYEQQVRAQDLHRFIVETQVETGGPYMLYKDACNSKSNQKNVGVIKCSNLCAEIVEYSAPDETAVCNLASIAVNRCIVDDKYDFELLRRITKVVVRNLDKIIDRNHYPLESARLSNIKHRPIGVGVQGLADAFVRLRMPYESESAALLNRQIAETIYYGALEASCELAAAHGPYSSYEGSPASRGILQYDMWNVTPSPLWDWAALKRKIKNRGLRNSLLVAYMPTATTAQILGNNESFEPFTSNVYLRRVLAGEFQVVNQYLIDDLIELNLYTDEMRNQIFAHRGSVQRIDGIPDHIKRLYKTAWEMKIKRLIEMAADRGAFIDQSQSFNLFVPHPTYTLMSSVHDYAWRMGLKTGMYYLRTQPAAYSQAFTVAVESTTAAAASCSRTAPDCAACQA
ncbi:ribonucleotide reductase large subunit [Peridroma alphabaculovirus]|uniref:Ribonucleoside-diphosphate reductase n=1 Tax=Peridroma alphabaculovirus TaxID=1346829 RepID=A0A068LKN8_9ABAC|nr:ribonucleotide reductase large subunit [Peridroma alphabaculovirus]AIE47862.1 ribonucleotide reductase large subunit [Peridroma alphabaculovirus]